MPAGRRNGPTPDRRETLKRTAGTIVAVPPEADDSSDDEAENEITEGD
jgi:hypothetical protein